MLLTVKPSSATAATSESYDALLAENRMIKRQLAEIIIEQDARHPLSIADLETENAELRARISARSALPANQTDKT